MFYITFESLSDVNKKMLTELSNIYRQFEQSDNTLWSKDFAFQSKPLLLVRTNKDHGIFRKEAFAINVPMENSFFAKEIKIPKSMGLPRIYRVSRFAPSTFEAWNPLANFGTFNTRGTEVMFFKYYPKMFSDPKLRYRFATFLLHEAFHIFHQKLWKYDAHGAEWIKNYPEEQEQYAVLGLEFNLLDKARAAKDIQQTKQYLWDWAVVRNYRYQKWPQLIAETKTEAIEGTAQYVQYQYIALIMGRKFTVLPTGLEPYHLTFMKVFDSISNNQTKRQQLYRDIRYETGSALGFLMDKADISWKQEIEDKPGKPGKTQYEILNDYFQLQGKATEEKIRELKKKYDFQSLLNKGNKIAKNKS